MTVILTKCIDLSVAANLALTGMVVALVNAAHPGRAGAAPDGCWPPASALALGAFNGALVWMVGIPPIVVTLGTLSIYRGLAFVASGGTSIVGRQMSPAFIAVPARRIPRPAGDVVVRDRRGRGLRLCCSAPPRIGRAFYAVGGNPTAAVYTGIDVGRTQFIAFCISGAIAGLCGYLWVVALRHRLCRYRRRLRARRDRRLRHRRRLDRRRHRHGRRRGARRALPRRRQERAAGHPRLAVLAAGDLRRRVILGAVIINAGARAAGRPADPARRRWRS